MTERLSGLRFDIYERVHLAEHAVGIKELDEVELVPHIQVFTEGERAVLKGNLYLTGKYEGEVGNESRTLEHYIPVEITLPLNRISQLEEVGVEIDNFDVDLLNPRSLNVTGVLTLQGIETISPADDSWKEEEETIFVHEAARSASDEQFLPVPEQAEGEARSPKKNTAAAKPSPEASEQEADEFFANSQDAVEFNDLFANEALEEQPSEPAFAPEAAEEPEETQEPIATAPQEPKIAFGSKQELEQPYQLKSLLHNEDLRPTASSSDPGQQNAENPSAQEGKSNAVEWKKLFVGDNEKNQQFSRLRAYIVQKEDSLETIAQRYKIHPREILLRNRLSEQDLSEGQVIYIPRP